jgi:hypothetical protein
VDDYWKILKQAQVLRVFSQFRWRSMRDSRAKEVRQLAHHDLHTDPNYAVTPQELRHHRLWKLLDACAVPLANAKDVQT